MIKERRRHPRLRIPLEAEYLVAGREEWSQGTIWTLGAGGAALLCEEKLEPGTQFEGLHFVVAAEGDLPETRIEVGAEVVGIDRKADFGRSSNFMLGLRFRGLGEQEFELLRQFVFRRLTGTHHAPDATEPEGAPDEKAGRPPIEIRFKLFDEFVEEVSENLSPTGMFIRAHRPLPPGSRFAFQFQLGDDFSIFQGTAEVVWTRRRGEGTDRPPGMGVRFLKLDLTSQRMVERLVGQRGAETPEEPAGATAGAAGGVEEEVAKGAAAEEQVAMPLVEAPSVEQPPPAQQQADEVAAKLRQRLARLEERVGELEAAREAAESAREEAEARLIGRGEEAEVLRQENQALSCAVGEAEEARGRAEAEAAELRRELEASRPDEGLEEQLRLSAETLDSRQREWRRLEEGLRTDLETRGAEETRLRERLEEAVRCEADLRQRIDLAEKTEAEQRQQIEQAAVGREELERQSERAGEAEERLDGLRHELKESRSEWDATEAALRAQLEQKSADESEARDRLAEAAGIEAELRQRLSELRGAGEESDRRLAQAAEVEAALREQARELRGERDDSGSKLARVAGQLDRMRGAAEQMRLRLNGDLTSARALETDLAEKLAEVAELGSGLDEKVAWLSEARAGLADRLARISEAWSGLEGGLDEIEAEEAVAGEPPAAEEIVPPPAETPEAPEAPSPADEAATLAAAEPEPRPDPPIEETLIPAPQETPPPEPKPESRLVGVARRAAARLGFARKPAAGGNGGEPEDDRLMAVELDDDNEAEPVATTTEELAGEAIEQTVRAWAAAWSERRVEDYLSFYSRDFEPERARQDEDAGEAPHAWLPPLAGMESRLGPISHTELAPGRFAVRFEQSVESDSYTRRTGRTLEMVREADAWKIAAESFQELPG